MSSFPAAELMVRAAAYFGINPDEVIDGTKL